MQVRIATVVRVAGRRAGWLVDVGSLDRRDDRCVQAGRQRWYAVKSHGIKDGTLGRLCVSPFRCLVLW